VSVNFDVIIIHTCTDAHVHKFVMRTNQMSFFVSWQNQRHGQLLVDMAGF